jgi:hypothetical protein
MGTLVPKQVSGLKMEPAFLRSFRKQRPLLTIFHYDFDGNIIGESDSSGNFSKEYLYRGSSRLALVGVSTGDILLGQ